MFTSEERDRVREWIFSVARADERITGGALTGSRSVGAEDPWSDVDTAFGVSEGSAPDAVLKDWTDLFEKEFDVVHYFDLRHGPTLYRVLLLANSLEVDISLTPATEFGARGPTFQLEFGRSEELPPTEAPNINDPIGWGWVYVLTARASVERGRLWQAEHWVDSTRDQGLALACVRHGLPAVYARGVDRLDPEVTARWEETLVRSIEPDELRRALSAVAREFVREVGEVRPALAGRLHATFSLDGWANG